MNTLNAFGNNATSADTTPTAHAGNANTPALLPLVDVVEDSSGITLYADLPGVPRDKLAVRVEGDQLTLEGETLLPPAAGASASQAAHAEVTLPRYRRTFTLSRELDADQVSAEFSQGVLRLRIPRTAQATPRRIDVRVG
jgi:HSP20 family protein